MPQRDYYEVLGVPRTATADQIKQAYRKLAKQYHPDRNRNDKSAETRFKEVQGAYDVLGDAEKRRQYDQFGAAGVGPGERAGNWRSGPGGGRVYTWRSGGGPDIPIEDWEDLFSTFSQPGRGEAAEGGGIFDQIFGRGQRGRHAAAEPMAGNDIEHPVTLTFDQAVHGTTLDLAFTEPGGTAAGTIRVKIPPGVSQGQRIRVRGKGQPGARGGEAGDLYIVAHIEPHPYFRRVGNDIYLDLPLTISEAALGSRVEIPTLEGRTVLTVPPGTPSGAKLRLKSKGVKPAGNEPQGDQYAVIRIVPPKPLGERQRQIIEELRETGEPNPRADLGW